MADGTKIEWTDSTWQIITGCSVVSPGCTNCYAMRLAGTRLQHHPSRIGLTDMSKAGPVWNGKVRFNSQWLDQPLRWRRPRRIFVCAHGDLFHEAVSDEWIDQVFAVMALAQQHTFQVLTKRPDRMRAYLAERAVGGRHVWAAGQAIKMPGGQDKPDPRWPLPNVWLGVSVEDQQRADERIPLLLRTPAAVRWISAEPLLGPVRLDAVTEAEETPDGLCGWHIDALRGDAWDDENGSLTQEYRDTHGDARIDWVVAGGESGPGARPMHPDWARSLRDQCQAAGVAFHFKQFGSWAPGDMPAWPETADLAVESGTGHYFEDGQWMNRVGKKRAGRELDGRTWDQYPEAL